MYSSRVSNFALNTSNGGRTPKHFSARNSTYMASGRKTTLVASSQRNQSLNLSAQTSQIVEESASHVVENFGTPLPVLVVEALSFVERCKDVSAKLDPSGWAWLVCGRRLFVWRFKLNPGQHPLSAPQCRELTLPPSDLAHKSDLVCLFHGDDRQVPSAVVVSPEGTIRHWPSIAHDETSVDMCADLQGQECFTLANCHPYGCVLGTTTGTLLIIVPPLGPSEISVQCRNLNVAKGVLARFGRRMSSFIFGGIPSQVTESRLVRVLVGGDPEHEGCILFALTDVGLQKWEIGEGSGDQLVMECDFNGVVREKFLEHVWNRDMLHPQQLKIWLLDIQLSKYGMFVLTSAVSPKEPHRMCFALAVIDVRARGIPTSLANFVVLNYTDTFQDDDEDVLLSYRLLFPDFSAECAYIYKDHVVICVPLYSGDELDTVKFTRPGDHILGAGSFDGIPLFFSYCHGIVSVMSSSLDESAVTTSTSGVADLPSMSENFNLTCSAAELESLATSADKTSQLKAALLLFCRKNLVQCEVLIHEAFPLSYGGEVEVNSAVDMAVASLSQQTIDDFPATDPRWAETLSSTEFCISSSMIILRQLEDKQKAYQLLLKFLQDTGLWERLRSVTVHGSVVSTRRLLYEHEEKLVAAKALRLIQPQFSSLMESAIKTVLRARSVAPSGKLTSQDLFYQEVSSIEDVVVALLEVERETVAEGTTNTIVATVSSVNSIILSVLHHIAQYRQLQRSDSSVVGPCPSEADSLPLSGSRDPAVLRSLLAKQHRITLDHAVKASQDTATRGALYQQVMDLADSVLHGYRCQLQYLESKGAEPGQAESILRKYEQDRTQLILPLLSAKQYDRAAALAEKYLDFEVLVQLCEATDNERLQRYMLQFEDQGFADFIYNWYLKRGKRGKLLSHHVLQRDSLQKFLEDHPMLSWLHDIHLEQYDRAQHTLKACALSEHEILARKKTYLSLSKLCALISDTPPGNINRELEALNKEQDLIMYQETLPAAVLESYGMDPDTMRVLSPVELIESYVSDENIGSNEYDFKKALDLLQFVEKESVEECERLRLHIWCRCILKDRWDEFDGGVDDPLEAGSQTMFFRTVELAYNGGMDLRAVLPHRDALLECLAPEPVSGNANFQFLLQACYEHIYRVMT